MKTAIKEVARVNYKSHIIRKVEDEFGNVFALVDNDSNEVENAPALMRVDEFSYASISDAKRAINGRELTWWTEEAYIRNDEYFKRFKS